MKKTRSSIAILLMSAWGLACSAQSGIPPEYNQSYRPQVHFSPKHNWTNDPNGLVYYQGKYHLFYQYNPFGDTWGHMSWGHAVSPDLTHWVEQPIAIPEKDGVMAFTGSVVVDKDDTSGLCEPQKQCLVAIYTGHSKTARVAHEDQNLAVSRDGGQTWTPYENNPVLDLNTSDFRDPSVTWNTELNQWLMTVALPKEHKVRFYKSADLKTWERVSEFGPNGYADGQWECPDLLWVPSDKAPGKGMYALKVGINPGALQGGSGEQYFLGDFKQGVFTPSREKGSFGWTNYGKDDYCAISYNGLPEGSRPILIGWMSNWDYAAKLPTAPWRGQMSIPRELSLLQDADGVALRQEPIIRAEVVQKNKLLLTNAGDSKPRGPKKFSAPFLVETQISKEQDGTSEIRFYSDDTHWTAVGYDFTTKTIFIDRAHSGKTVSEQFSPKMSAPFASARPLDLKILVDRSSVEVFAQDGTIAMTGLIFPDSNSVQVAFASSNADNKTLRTTVSEFASAWK